jgi:hypothetical protein
LSQEAAGIEGGSKNGKLVQARQNRYIYIQKQRGERERYLKAK